MVKSFSVLKSVATVFFPIHQHFLLRRRSMRSELSKISAIPAWTNRSLEMVQIYKSFSEKNVGIHNFQFEQFDKSTDSIKAKFFKRTITAVHCIVFPHFCFSQENSTENWELWIGIQIFVIIYYYSIFFSF